MTSVYQQSVPILLLWWKNTTGILDKGVAWQKEKKMSDEEFLNLRLIEDMQPLSFQVKTMSRFTQHIAGFFGSKVDFDTDTSDTTVEGVRERIAKCIAGLEAAKESVETSTFANEEYIMKVPFGTFKFTHASYVQQFALSNFYFHYTTFYNILRKEGVQLGKGDWLNGTLHKVE